MKSAQRVFEIFVVGVLLAVIGIPIASALNSLKLDQQQTGGPPPSGVQSAYKPFCDSTSAVRGNFLPVSTYLAYNASGVVSTVTELDGVSGVSGTNTYVTTLTYSGSNLASTSCPVKQ